MIQEQIGWVVHDYGDHRIKHPIQGPSHESKYIIGLGTNQDWLVLKGANSGLLYFVDLTEISKEDRKLMFEKWGVDL